MAKPGRQKTVIYSKVHRISLTEVERDLMPFFEALDQLPPDRRSEALFAAIRNGQGAAKSELAQTESGKAGRAIDALIGAFDDE